MRRFGALALIMLVSLLLTACGGGGEASPAGDTSGSVVRWPRDPQHIIFRAEVTGGEDEGLVALNEVPLCTLYGDGRLVWTVAGEGGLDDVRFDFLDDVKIIDFVNYLVVSMRIYTYEAEYDFQLPQSTTPVYERMILNVNDRQHATDDFAEWPVDYFEDIVERCQSIAPTPRIFEPQGAWLSVQQVDYQNNRPSVFWEADAAGLSLQSIAQSGERRWIEGNLVIILWRTLRDTALDMQFNEGNAYYQIALQVPGVTADAPLAPAQ